MIRKVLRASVLAGLCVTATATAAAAADERVTDADVVRFKGGRVAEVSVGRRPSAPNDEREWVVLRLNEVGLVVVGDDGKSEVLAVDKHGGVYINGDLYIKGVKVTATPSIVEGEVAAPEPPGAPGSRWLLLGLFLLSVLTSVSISIGLRRRGP